MNADISVQSEAQARAYVRFGDIMVETTRRDYLRIGVGPIDRIHYVSMTQAQARKLAATLIDACDKWEEEYARWKKS